MNTKYYTNRKENSMEIMVVNNADKHINNVSISNLSDFFHAIIYAFIQNKIRYYLLVIDIVLDKMQCLMIEN